MSGRFVREPECLCRWAQKSGTKPNFRVQWKARHVSGVPGLRFGMQAGLRPGWVKLGTSPQLWGTSPQRPRKAGAHGRVVWRVLAKNREPVFRSQVQPSPSYQNGSYQTGGWGSSTERAGGNCPQLTPRSKQSKVCQDLQEQWQMWSLVLQAALSRF